jgi:aminoglycoside N3'-acetyltransferase
MNRVEIEDIVRDLRQMGVEAGDFVLLRGALGAIGRIEGGAATIIQALLDVVGPNGTIASLAFTDSTIRNPDPNDPYHLKKKSYAGALPNAMIKNDSSFRSLHPTCSYVAIGKYAEEFVKGHDESAGAYEPIRRLVDRNGKCMLIGCVGSSPGFTTTHLVESDLGHLKKVIFPRLTKTYYLDADGDLKLFRRRDVGLCSSSFYKFYAHYVAKGYLTTGYIGKAYSIIGPAKECYDIEKSILGKDPKFNICDSPECMMCNARRWDRIHKMPMYIFRRLIKK